MIGAIGWVVIGVVMVALLAVVDIQLRDWRAKKHAYKMKRLQYDEKAVADAEDHDD